MSIIEFAEKFKLKTNINLNNNQMFITSINLTSEDISFVYNATIEQSNCEEWIKQCKGRITASKFKRMFTRMETLKIKGEEPNRLTNEILGPENVVQT